MYRFPLAAALILGAAASLQPSCAQGGASEDALAQLGTGTYAPLTNFGANPGALRMFLYTPPGIGAGAPAVVVFHGCLQQAVDMRGAGWEPLADEHGFYIAYAEQPSANNPVSCFNWAGEYGDPANMIRGKGENQSVASMVGTLVSNFQVNPDRVFASGFSAGAAMVPVMLATWPDLFAAGSLNAGVPYFCASSVNGAFSCMSSGRDRTPAAWGDEVRGAFPSFSGPYPRVSIWHGSADATVSPINQRESMEQWTNVHGLQLAPTTQDTLEGLPRARWEQNGVVVVETVVVTGMAHGQAIDAAKGCGTASTYIKDVGVCAARYQAEFFGLDVTAVPPDVEITAPTDGATVNGTLAVRGSASGPAAIEEVELRVDGVVRLAIQSPAPSFEFAWDSSAEQDGQRSLAVTATDSEGQSATATISVIVEGGLPDLVAPSVAANPPGGSFVGAQTIVLESNEPAAIFYTTDGSTPCIGCTEYTGPLMISASTTLRFLAVDLAGNVSSTVTESYAIASFDESANGTCTEHYVARRLNVSGYLACGGTHGYIAKVMLYRFGSCWTENPAGAGCP